MIGLFFSRRFWPLFSVQFLGAFNDNFLKSALVLLVTFQARTVFGLPPAQAIAAAGGIFILPFFLFSGTAGALSDRFDKTRIIRAIKLAEIGIMLVAAVGFWASNAELLFLALFLMGVHSSFFGPVKYSVLPERLRAAELVEGNALIEAGTFLSILLGTIAGGLLVASGAGEGDRKWVLILALLAVATLGYLCSLAIPLRAVTENATATEASFSLNPVPPTRDIFRVVRRDPRLFWAIVAISWFWFVGAALLSILPDYAKIGWRADASVVTLFLAAFTLGVGVGSLVCGWLSRRGLNLGWVPVGSIGLSVFLADLAFRGGAPEGVEHLTAHGLRMLGAGRHVLADLFLLCVFGGFFIVPLYTFLQKRAASAELSRVIAANNILNAVFMVAASLLLIAGLRAGLGNADFFLMLALANALFTGHIFSVFPEIPAQFGLLVRPRKKGKGRAGGGASGS